MTLGANELNLLAMAGLAVFAIALVVLHIHVIQPFLETRRYYKQELARAASENEYAFWRSRLVRLYLKHIPIVGLFVRKRRKATSKRSHDRDGIHRP